MKEEKIKTGPYTNPMTGIVIVCKNCGCEFEETAQGYYRPMEYERDKYNRYCSRCLLQLGYK
jgi:hypothetical protein